MAELSLETQAIINRLKDEGKLIRNGGVNSLRAVNINLEKLAPLFDVISLNVAEQTKIMQRQLGLNEAAIEKRDAAEQLAEITPPPAQKDFDEPTKKPLVTDDEKSKINAMGDAIANALSFKNLALGGAAVFVGYNFLKGFIDEKYGGAFTNMEKGIGAIGPKLSEFANFDLEGFKTSFESMSTNISNLGVTLSELNTSIKDIKDAFVKFSENPIVTTLDWALENIGYIGVGLAGIRYLLIRAGTDLKNGMKPKGGVPWWRRALGLGPDVDAPKAPGAAGVPKDAPKVAPTGGGRGSYGMDTPEARMAMRQGYANSAAGKAAGVKFNEATGRVHKPAANGGSGKMMSDADIAKQLEASLSPKYARVYNALTKVLKIAKPAMAVVELLRILYILNDDSLTQDQKMMALAPIIGEMVGGLGGAAVGAVVGAMGGPWGALIGGIGLGILGAFGGNKLGQYIVEWAFEEDPDAIAKAEVESITGVQSALDAAPQIESVAPAPPRPRSNGGRNNLQGRWDKQYGATHNPDGSPMAVANSGAGGGRGTVVEKPGEREQHRLYMEQLEREKIIPLSSNAKLQSDLALASSGGAGAPVIINAPTIAPSSVNVSNGGSSVNQLSISNGGGGGIGPSMLPYGLTGAFS